MCVGNQPFPTCGCAAVATGEFDSPSQITATGCKQEAGSLEIVEPKFSFPWYFRLSDSQSASVVGIEMIVRVAFCYSEVSHLNPINDLTPAWRSFHMRYYPYFMREMC